MSSQKNFWRVLSWLAVSSLSLLIKIAQHIKQLALHQGSGTLQTSELDPRLQQLGQLVDSFVLVEIFSQKTTLNRWLDLRRLIEAQKLPLDTTSQQLSTLQGSIDIGERFAGFLLAYMQTHGTIQPPVELLLQRLDQAVYQYGLNSVAVTQVPVYATHYRKNSQRYYAVYCGWIYEWDATARYYFPVSDLEFDSVAAFLAAPTVQVVQRK
ncbi:MAG: hypothetical protein VXW65_08400 [Pseudomonadota bacterium]|nr:hypothetical protein [Pseudomonadota bacterium]